MLLLCHATGLCAKAYERLARELAAGFFVLAPDFRGHGETPAEEGTSFAWDELAADLLAVCDFARDELGAPGPFSGFGHSMGGAVLLLAELARPGLLRSAYLYEPIVFPDELVGFDPVPLAESARRRRPTFPSKAEALARYASRPPFDRIEAGALADYVEAGFVETGEGEVRLRCDPEDEAATFEASGKLVIGQLGAVAPRVTIGGGLDEDGVGPSSWAPAVAAALPGGSFEAYDYLGHFGPLEDPRQVAARVLRALEA